jgi:hypothetical protein
MNELIKSPHFSDCQLFFVFFSPVSAAMPETAATLIGQSSTLFLLVKKLSSMEQFQRLSNY